MSETMAYELICSKCDRKGGKLEYLGEGAFAHKFCRTPYKPKILVINDEKTEVPQCLCTAGVLNLRCYYGDPMRSL